MWISLCHSLSVTLSFFFIISFNVFWFSPSRWWKKSLGLFRVLRLLHHGSDSGCRRGGDSVHKDSIMEVWGQRPSPSPDMAQQSSSLFTDVSSVPMPIPLPGEAGWCLVVSADLAAQRFMVPTSFHDGFLEHYSITKMFTTFFRPWPHS